MARAKTDDTDFLQDLRDAAQHGPHWSASLLLATVFAFFVVFLVWSASAELDQVAKGDGRVIPSGEIKVVQNLEGGIVAEILVAEGDKVEAGEVMFRMDPTSAEATFKGDRAEYLGLLASKARLDAEAEGRSPAFPPEVRREAPYLISSELALYQGRRAELRAAIDVLTQQRDQRRQELSEARGRQSSLERQLSLINEEVAITMPNVQAGITSRVELLRLQQQQNQVEGDLESARLSIPRLRAQISEAERRIQERRNAYRREVLDQLSAIGKTLAGSGERLRAQEDRLARREVRASVAGIVKSVEVTTVGGVVQPGEAMAEIVPVDDSLLVSARVSPSDIAFLYPGLDAKVKLTAYDFIIYGGLDGEVERIGADSKTDEQGNIYYDVSVRTDRNYLGTQANPLPIIPGMIAQVDIITGKKTVLQYLMKPILRAREAFRER